MERAPRSFARCPFLRFALSFVEMIHQSFYHGKIILGQGCQFQRKAIQLLRSSLAFKDIVRGDVETLTEFEKIFRTNSFFAEFNA